MARPRIIIADTDVNYILSLQLKFVEEFFEKIDLEIITDRNYFENMFDGEAYMTALPGFTEQTKVLIDDLLCWPEGLYLPSDPILYFTDSEKRSDFVRVNTDPEKRLALYIALIKHVLETAETKSALPGFDTPALKDLIENMDSMNIEQLVERYKDSKWFNGTIKI